MNIRAINSENINPHVVVQNVIENIANIKELYVVAIPKEDNSPEIIWATGSLKELPKVVMLLQDLCLKYINNKIF